MSQIEIRRNEDGLLDEIVAKNVIVHLEQMDAKHWWIGIYDGNGGGMSLDFIGCKRFVFDPDTRGPTGRTCSAKENIVQEIIINFPKSCNGIKLIDSDELKEYYQSRGESVPPSFVFMPYVRIAEKYYVVLPFAPKDVDAAQQSVHWTAFGTGWLARFGKFILGLGYRLAQIGVQ